MMSIEEMTMMMTMCEILLLFWSCNEENTMMMMILVILVTDEGSEESDTWNEYKAIKLLMY